MKICVINYSGNVGKSIISQHLLKPRLEDAEIIAVESINFDGSLDEKIKGKNFTKIISRALSLDNAVIDVGASNVEDFLQQMKRSIGSHEDMDLFVVPTTNKKKQIIDTINTLQALQTMGIEKERIKVIFNMVDDDTDYQFEFGDIFDIQSLAIIDERLSIQESELFDRLGESNDLLTISELAQDATDYKKLIAESDNQVDRLNFANALGLKRLAVGVERMLNATFEHLISK
ncbi:StbB family protein [Photobacterium damselae]|uniref:StbB family protein n=1 Tax=Photobacterium damselae TaxID=38293 RepID=UPI0040689701